MKGPRELAAGAAAGVAALCSALWNSGPWSMALSAWLFSISSLLVKLTGGRIPTFEIVTFRSTVSFLLCAIGARQARISPLFGKRANWPALIGRGMFGATAMSCYYLSIQALPLADAVTLFFLNPAVTAVAAWLLLGEPLGWVGACGVVLSVVGLVILSQPPFLFQATDVGWDKRRVLGTSYGLISALCATGAFICIRLIGKREPALVMSVYFHTCAFLSSSIPLAIGIPVKAVLPSPVDFVLLCGIATMSFWGQILVGRAFQLLTAAKGSAINFTQVLYSYIFGIALLHEDFSLWGGLGSILITSGVLLVNMRHKPKQTDTVTDTSPAAGPTTTTVLGRGEDDSTTQETQPLLAADAAHSHTENTTTSSSDAHDVAAAGTRAEPAGTVHKEKRLSETAAVTDAVVIELIPTQQSQDTSQDVPCEQHYASDFEHVPLLAQTWGAVQDSGGVQGEGVVGAAGVQGGLAAGLGGSQSTPSASSAGTSSNGARVSAGVIRVSDSEARVSTGGSSSGARVSDGSAGLGASTQGHYSDTGTTEPHTAHTAHTQFHPSPLGAGSSSNSSGVIDVGLGLGRVGIAAQGVSTAQTQHRRTDPGTSFITHSTGTPPQHELAPPGTHGAHASRAAGTSAPQVAIDAEGVFGGAGAQAWQASGRSHNAPQVSIEPFLVSSPRGAPGDVAETPGTAAAAAPWRALARVLGHMDSRIMGHGLMRHGSSLPHPRSP